MVNILSLIKDYLIDQKLEFANNGKNSYWIMFYPEDLILVISVSSTTFPLESFLASLLKKLLDRKPFGKRLDRKPQQHLSLRILSPKLIRRDQPAQRLRVNGCIRTSHGLAGHGHGQDVLQPELL
ncbi:hypothetical protein [Methanosarcina barkeri]|uniref:Uncharacterized protein n=1 Tax=Methanosarcina barkeri CM1 TaxID=796385 RepID=A0A0G3CAE0_METBA|nr:hypothetical protein [Methanosarcina barkeri]AKJ38976.1 hypothetical protein MCM1_1954 [Methanosarcina barkeri CM1]